MIAAGGFRYCGLLFMKVFFNGELVDQDQAKVSVFDHGLLYGDGVFEGIRAYNGRVFKLREHVDRLFFSAKAILLTIPMTHDQVCQAVVDTCRANGIRDGYVRLVVTRGPGTLGLNPFKCVNPLLFVIADKIQLYPPHMYQDGMDIITVATTRNHQNAVNPAIKSLNYLNNILAKIEAVNCGYEEAIMLNPAGYVAECTGDNIFIIRGNSLLTPPLEAGALYGITRQTAMDIASKLGLSVSEPNLTRYDLYNADECFLTGTAAEVMPVVKIDGRVIGSGKPGPVTRQIVEHYKDLTTSSGEPL